LSANAKKTCQNIEIRFFHNHRLRQLAQNFSLFIEFFHQKSGTPLANLESGIYGAEKSTTKAV
jgi:hypothetical protein